MYILIYTNSFHALPSNNNNNYYYYTNDSLPSLLLQAAKSAAEADGLAPPPIQSLTPPPPPPLHSSTPSSSTSNGPLNKVNNNNNNNNSIPVTESNKTVSQNNQPKDPSSVVAAIERARNTIAPPLNANNNNNKQNANNNNNNNHQLTAKPVQTHSTMLPQMPRKPVSAPLPSSSSSPISSGKKKGPPLRRGKWTTEEEGYANRLIQEFKAGLLPLTDGTTLRTFLSKLLNCDPMRISKKFVGSNCIGKQVFRRRTADINRLTPEQIQQSRIELSELERRFLERVAQTNRVKSSGVGVGAGGVSGVASSTSAPQEDNEKKTSPPSPPWLKPPLGYKQGQGAAMAAASLSGGAANQRAAAAGRALLGSLGGIHGGEFRGNLNPSFTSRGSAGMLAMADLQSNNSRQSFFNSMGSDSANNILQALGHSGGSASTLFASGGQNSNNAGLSGSAMAQIARNASAARLASLTAAGSSMNNLLLKSGLSRDQLSQLARDGGMSSASLSNMMDRQSSFDALMSLDLQSLQSIDNLANLIQSGSAMPGSIPQNGLKNADFNLGTRVPSNHAFSNPNLASAFAAHGSSAGLADHSHARRLASIGRMESLLRSLSSQNVNKLGSSAGVGGGGGSNANFNNLLQSMHNNLNNSGVSTNSLFGNVSANSTSALSLANLFRADSGTGLSALRMQDGLNQRNSSVDDFLSLVAAGDIPHQDASLLNLSLMQQQQQQQGVGQGDRHQSAASLLQQQLLQAHHQQQLQLHQHQQQQQSVGGSNAALVNALARSGSFGSQLRGNSSAASLFSNGSAASLLQQHQAQQQARAALSGMGSGSSSALKRKLMELEGSYHGKNNSK